MELLALTDRSSLFGGTPDDMSGSDWVALMTTAHSIKVDVIADSSGIWAANSLRFQLTETGAAAARDYARGLAARWLLVQKWRLWPSTDIPSR